MIDIHSHILPGIDDGAKDLTESLALLKMAQNDGITHIVATPHIHLGRFNNTLAQISHALANLKNQAIAQGLTIQLAAASEVRLDIELMTLVMANHIPFIGEYNNHRYLLLELPHSHVPQGYDKFIKWLITQRVKVIIAHPERNRDIQCNTFYIESLKQLGCEFQLTASSIEGGWGEKAMQISHTMLKNNMVNYVASDAHSVNRRPPILSKARAIVANITSENNAQALFVTNPWQLTQGLFNDPD